jgi:hypothetical protein
MAWLVVGGWRKGGEANSGKQLGGGSFPHAST